jgi:hypothetical protein
VITDVPRATPVTTPVVELMVAIAVLLLTHVPPGNASLRLIVEPTHTALGPEIGAGNGLMVTVRTT